VPQLEPGDELVLLDGVYEPGGTGFFDAVCTDPYSWETAANHGTESSPITVRAQNERQAWLRGDGSFFPFKVFGCSYWNFEGLRVSNGDFLAEEGEWDVKMNVYVVDSDHLELRRFLVHDVNRYYNSAGIQINSSTDVLVEESEIYFFHRHGIDAHNSERITIRRTYANARGAADIEGGFVSHPCCEEGGDEAYSYYYSSDSIMENAVSVDSENLSNVTGQDTVLGNPGGHDNQSLGNISYRDLRPGTWHSRIFETSGSVGGGGVTRDFLVIGKPETTSQLLWGLTDHLTENTTWVEMDYYPIMVATASSASEFVLCNELEDSCDFTVRDSLFLNTTSPVFYGEDTEYVQWRVEYSNAFLEDDPEAGFGVTEVIDDAEDDYQSSLEVEPTGMGLGEGQCVVYVPEGSPMKGAGSDGGDIGAEILYRYEDGVLTDEPLWDVETGAFPCGVIVEGVNDVAGDSCFDIHEQINVNSNGCTLPYSEPPPADLVASDLSVSAGGWRGAPLSIQFTRANAGQGAAPPFALSVHLSADAAVTADDPEVCRRVVWGMGAGASVAHEVNDCALPALPPGAWYVGVLLDPDDYVAEADEDNNAAVSASTLTMGTATPGSRYPDLAVWEVTAGAYAGEPGDALTVDYLISNSADRDADDVVLSIRASPTAYIGLESAEVCAVSLGSVGALSSLADAATCAVPDLPAGDYYIGALLDPEDAIEEWREYNNSGLDPTPYTISPAATRLADLVPFDVAFDAYEGAEGDGVEMSFSLANDGDTDAAEVEVGAYLSRDEVIDPADTWLCSATFDALAAGASSAGLALGVGDGCALPADMRGIWYIGALADPGGAVEEWNESNNGAAAPSLFIIY